MNGRAGGLGVSDRSPSTPRMAACRRRRHPIELSCVSQYA